LRRGRSFTPPSGFSSLDGFGVDALEYVGLGSSPVLRPTGKTRPCFFILTQGRLARSCGFVRRPLRPQGAAFIRLGQDFLRCKDAPRAAVLLTASPVARELITLFLPSSFPFLFLLLVIRKMKREEASPFRQIIQLLHASRRSSERGDLLRILFLLRFSPAILFLHLVQYLSPCGDDDGSDTGAGTSITAAATDAS